MIRLPDDFWSVSENEPGLGGTVLALLTFLLVLVAIFGCVLLVAASMDVLP